MIPQRAISKYQYVKQRRAHKLKFGSATRARAYTHIHKGFECEYDYTIFRIVKRINKFVNGVSSCRYYEMESRASI